MEHETRRVAVVQHVDHMHMQMHKEQKQTVVEKLQDDDHSTSCLHGKDHATFLRIAHPPEEPTIKGEPHSALGEWRRELIATYRSTTTTLV